MNRHSAVMKAIGFLTLASMVGCGGVAHSLGGDDVKQKIDQDGGGSTPVDQGSGGANPSGGSTPINQGSGGSTPIAQGTGGAAPIAQGTGGTAPIEPAGPPSACGVCKDVVFSDGNPQPTFFTFYGCCLPDNTCGVDISLAAQWLAGQPPGKDVSLAVTGCQPRAQVGIPDTSCPGVAYSSIQFDGCCRSDGMCGTDLSGLGAGCVQTKQSTQPGAYVDGGPLPTPLPPQTCTYP